MVVAGAAGQDVTVAGGSANPSGAFSVTGTDLEGGVYTVKAVGGSGSVGVVPLTIK
jgi:hypothetical protein